MKNLLVEKWNELIESPKAKSVSNKEAMAQLLENQEAHVNENAQNVAADIAQYTPILVPAVRRVFPNLLANEIVGVQPMQTPTGYAYALRYQYAKADGQTLRDRGQIDHFNPGRSAAPVFGGCAIVTASAIPVGAASVADGTGTIGTIVHAEGNKALVQLAVAGNLPAPGDAITFADAGGAHVGGADTVSLVFNNEAGYNLLFKNFAQVLPTAQGEQLGKPGTDFRSMKMSLERVAIEAMTRKLKAEYTIELAQDLKAVHGLDAEAELINILEYEITAELDRELVDAINGSATVVAERWSYAAGGAPIVADGRWEQERFRTLYTKITREANIIALTSRRGAGNFIIASTNVITALENLPNFMYSAVPGDVKPTFGVAKVGTLDGRFTVYCDTFAYGDYVTVGYKGPSQFDTGIIYCPYIPLMLQKVTDPDTFQPKLGFMTRDAIAGNLFGAQNYYRTFAVDFTGSTLQGSYFK